MREDCPHKRAHKMCKRVAIVCSQSVPTHTPILVRCMQEGVHVRAGQSHTPNAHMCVHAQAAPGWLAHAREVLPHSSQDCTCIGSFYMHPMHVASRCVRQMHTDSLCTSLESDLDSTFCFLTLRQIPSQIPSNF